MRARGAEGREGEREGGTRISNLCTQSLVIHNSNNPYIKNIVYLTNNNDNKINGHIV